MVKLVSKVSDLIVQALVLVGLASVFGLVIGLVLSFLPADLVPFTSAIIGLVALTIVIMLGKTQLIQGLKGLDVIVMFFVLGLISTVIVTLLQGTVPSIGNVLISFNAPIATFGDLMVLLLWYSALIGLANWGKVRIMKAV